MQKFLQTLVFFSYGARSWVQKGAGMAALHSPEHHYLPVHCLGLWNFPSHQNWPPGKYRHIQKMKWLKQVYPPNTTNRPSKAESVLEAGRGGLR